MGEGLRWQERQKVTDTLAEDLGQMQNAIEASAGGAFHETVRQLLEDSHEGELVDWVTIAIHRHPDGSTTTSIQGEPNRSNLQIKGLLHDAVWAAAHRD